MAIDTFIAGAYTGTYNAVAIGITEDGFELEQQTTAEAVDRSDVYGDSVLDYVHRGGNVYITYNSLAWKAGSVTPFYPWSATLGVHSAAATPIARLASNVAAATALTVTTGTPARATTPNIDVFTASKTILAPNSNLRLLFTSRLRKVPIRLVCLPTNNAGTVTWFTSASN